MKKIKQDKIKLVAKQPSKIKAALQSFVTASDQVHSDPLGLDEVPPWVEKAWLAGGLVPGVNQLAGFGLVRSLQTGALAGLGVHTVERAATAATTN